MLKERRVLCVIAVLLVVSQRFFAQSAPSAPSTTPDEVTLSIIVVSSADKASQILEQLKRGEDFAQLAKKQSIDSTSDEGGLMGKVALSTLRPELRDAVQRVGPGRLSPVVQTPLGFAILKVAPNSGADDRFSAGANPGASAVGSVKYTLTVSGLNQVLAAVARTPQPAGWTQDLPAICRAHKQAASSYEAVLEDFVSPAKQSQPERSPMELLTAYFSLGEIHSHQGEMDQAIEQYEAACRIAEADIPQATLQLTEALGIAYLHKSEMENDVFRAPGDRCLLPMPPGNAYEKTEDSQKAVEYFLKYLEQKPDELEVRWLLNLAYMTLGTYPNQVPRQYLIPPSAFASAEDVGRFVDIAPQAGLDTFSMAGGVIVDDFENNGRLDIVKSSFNSCAPMQFFHNNGDGTFTDEAVKAGLADQLGGLNIMQTDYNNDGCMDILVLRGAWETSVAEMRKSLLRNNCDGTFTDVTAPSGLAEPATNTQAGVWVDINNDGLLDLFIANEDQPAQLFLNKGNGTFEDISASAGIDRTTFAKGVAAADYDNDGYPDLFVSNLTGNNFLYHNNHNNTFTEVAGPAGVRGPAHGFATWFFDYDNDGWPDLFVTSYFTSVDETARTYLGLPHNATTLRLYKNMRNGTFRDVSAEVGLDKVFMPMGANFGDIDNDGFLDIYLGTGNPSYGSLVPNVLLRNHDGKFFVDVTASSGTGDLHKGHGVAFADLENNGQEDILAEMGGATPGDSHAMRVFKNPGNGNDWITLKLVGVKTNRAAIGARIKLTVENQGQGIRSIYRTVGSGGSFGSSPLQQHIGLGKSARIADLEIWWPTSNTRQHFTGVKADQFLEIKEFATDYTKLERQPYRLGRTKRDAAIAATQPEQGPEKSK